MMIGLRGAPNVPGGVERHVERLSLGLSKLGCEVEIVARSRYVARHRSEIFANVTVTPIWSPASKTLEAILHSAIATLYAAVRRPDVLHIHAIGPALVTPMARLLGLKVVVTHHGADYDRERWGPIAKMALRFGERVGTLWASERIAVSKAIAESIERRYARSCTPIVNGVDLPEPSSQTDKIEEFGLERNEYILSVGRIVPEKRQVDLIEAYRKADLGRIKLVLAGGVEYQSDYTRQLKDLADATPGVVLTGYVTGEPLKQLFSHARGFVLPSSHEGLPIALLEALSFGLPVAASAIPANLEVPLDDDAYFPVGDIQALSAKLKRLVEIEDHGREERRQLVAQNFSWSSVTKATYDVYAKTDRSNRAPAEDLGATPEAA